MKKATQKNTQADLDIQEICEAQMESLSGGGWGRMTIGRALRKALEQISK